MAEERNQYALPTYYGIKKKAIRAYIELIAATEKSGPTPCANNPYYYTDFTDGNQAGEELTEDDCEALCADCPLLKLCYDFAVLNEEENGVWGGISFYKKIDW